MKIKNSLFFEEDYKKFLREIVSSENSWGLLSKMAEAAQCQKSYLSRVIHKEIHLTPEQAYRISNFLELDGDAQNYFCLLVDLGRSGDSQHQKFLGEKLGTLRKAYEKKSKGFDKKQSAADLDLRFYYTRIDWMLVHYMTSIPQFQKIEPLAKATSKQADEIEIILENLQRLGLVEKSVNRWIFKSGDEHLNDQHPLLGVLHRLMRERAIRDFEENEGTGLHFSSVQTISKSDANKIKTVVLKMIENFHRTSRPSSPEKLVILNIDYFDPFAP